MPFGRKQRGQQPPTYTGPQPPTHGGWGSQPPQYGQGTPPPNRGNQGGTPGVIYLVLLVIAIGIVYAFTKGIF